MTTLRLVLAAMVAAFLVPFAAGAANAAPPSNDEATGATVLHLGDRVEQDTTQATTNAGDDALNANCGAPATNASVWFKYTPGTTRNVVLDATASSYSAGFMVFDGTPTADDLVTCGPGEVGLKAQAAETYYVMAFSDTDVIGGDLIMTLSNAPTPTAHVSVSKHGVAFHGGAAKLHGTYRCKHDESFAGVSAHLLQRAGRLKIQSDGGANVQCDGKRHQWSARLVSPVGTYAQGHAVAKVRIDVCGLLQCRHDKSKGHVNLKRGSGSHRSWMTHPTTGRFGHPLPRLSRQGGWPSR